MTTMTDEELSEVLARVRRELGHVVESDVASHIAALTAERERWQRDALSLQDSLALAGAELREVTADRDALLRQRDGIARNLDEARAERDALRERKKALEKVQGKYFARLQAVTDALTATRQRAGDVEALTEAWHRDEHSASVHGTAHSFSSGCAAVARYIIGDDGAAREETKAERLLPVPGFPMPPAAVRDAIVRESSDVPEPATADPYPDPHDCDPRALGDVAEALGVPPGMAGYLREVSGPSAEPTTAEAFATARDVVEEFSEGDERLGWRVLRKQLSLLERRMGAQRMVVRRLRDAALPFAHAETSSEDERQALRDACVAADVLTDAPPVFMLEEKDVNALSAGAAFLRTLHNHVYRRLEESNRDGLRYWAEKLQEMVDALRK